MVIWPCILPKRLRWDKIRFGRAQKSRKIEEQAFLAHRAMQARDFSLYDVRIDPSGEPFFLEACNFCSFSPKSAMVAMANAAGRQHPEVFEMVMDRAASRKVTEEGEVRLLGMGAR